MTNLSEALREKLKENFDLHVFRIIKKQVSKDGTKKYLFDVLDNNAIESVLMEYKYGKTICVSSQIGCKMGCKFCASGKLKLIRKLRPFEFVLQYYMIYKYLREEKSGKVNNIVVMGVGEPFDNYDNLMDALRIINNPYGIEIGSRHITVSTYGIIPKIIQFAKDQPQINLAISLHAPTDEIRNKIMPINKSYPLKALLSAIDKYISITNRRVGFEYIMIDGLNDTNECLKELIKIARKRLCFINLIAYNHVSKSPFNKSKKINQFKYLLNKNNIMTTLRLERGSNIDAACGQLRAKYEK